MKKIINLLITLLPWFIKRRILNIFYKYELHPEAYIGFSYIYPKFLKMEKGAYIGNLNVAVNLDTLIIGENSSIARSNWITGFPTGSGSKHFAHDKQRRSQLIIGHNSAITKKHHLDCTNAVSIGNYVTIGGYNSCLLSHSIDIYECRQDSAPITIGDYVFISTGVTILGGASLPDCSALGAGAVLNKKYTEKHQLYGGVPAKPLKNISNDAKYFNRTEGYIY